KHPTKPVQFDAPPAPPFKFFDECFCLIDCFQSFGGATRQMQGFSLSAQEIWQADDRAGCPILSDSVLDQRDTFHCVTEDATYQTSLYAFCGKGKRKIVAAGEFNKSRRPAVHFSRISLIVSESRRKLQYHR